MSPPPSQNDYPALLRRAYLSLEKLQARLDSMQRARSEPIAIIGMGCRFPGGAENPDCFWRLLHEGQDAITEIPPERWDVDRYYDPNPNAPGKMYTRTGGFLKQVDLFDAQFFGISPREAVSMDPQQRLVLEVAWEALEDAGQAPDGLVGSHSGVFIGISTNEYAHLLQDPGKIDLYTPTGNALSIAAGRLSYILGLHGPSLAVDTACSSSLAAVHLAFQSLRNEECDMAIAGGVNLLLSPTSSIGISELRMLTPDGRCKTFDAGADGFVRAEGCGIVVLKRLSEAVANGDRILALIRGSALNQDGRTGGLTAPNGPAQEMVIRRALANGRVSPSEVQYVEAHGTGTSLGDPIEVQAIASVLGEGRQPGNSFAIGSVKTNIGHLEAAAGVAGLIKTVLALRHEEIPPHLHLKNLTPHVAWDRIPVVIPTEPAPWPQGSQRRIAGVSAFGFGGTNAHVVLEEAPEVAPAAAGPERPLHLLTLSAKEEQALSQLAERYEQRLGDGGESFADVCYTANTGRAHFRHRLAVLAESAGQAQAALAAIGRREPGRRCFAGQVEPGAEPKLAFLFSGQGSQYVGMGRTLYETQPLFRETLTRCERMLEGYLDRPLLAVLYPAEGALSPLDDTAYTQPALFALEYALAELWRSWGVEPRVVLGHSVGEYVAACVAGIFTLEEGIRLVAERGRLMQELPAPGAMAAVFASETEVRRRLRGYEKEVAVAAVNGPDNTVISGEQERIEELTSRLQDSGIPSRRLRVSQGFHSPLMEAMLPAFERAAEKVRYGKAQLTVVTNLTGRAAMAGEMENAGYWVRQLRETVRFREAMETVREQGCGVMVEVGPKPTLLGLGQQCLGTEAAVWLGSLREGRNDWEEILNSVARLYLAGMQLDWQGFDRGYPRRRVSLPTYPFQRKRFWFDARAIQQPGRLADSTAPAEVAPMRTSDPWRDWLYETRWEPKARPDPPLPADFIPTPSEIVTVLEQGRAAVRSSHNLAAYAELIPQLDRLAAFYIAEALGQLGWQWRAGVRVRTESAAELLGVTATHQRFLERLFGILQEEGFLRETEGEYAVICSPTDQPAPESASPLMVRYPDMRAELVLLERSGRQLASVLRGSVNPLEVLFPGGSMDTLEAVYRDSPAARACNTLVQQAVSEAARRLPEGRTLRILELGAGTGGTTSFVLPALPALTAEYVFTDVSPQFTAKAAATFQAFPFVRSQTLDVERDPMAQGFQSHRFDVILAVNVLHATADLRQVLRHVRQLLAPGGLVVLVEGSAPQRWLDLIFGMTEGWWKFSGDDLRANHPLLSKDGWLTLLERSGFPGVAALPDAGDGGPRLAEPVLIMAQAPAAGATEARNDWLIFADRKGVAKQLAAALRERGDDALLVFPSDSNDESDGGNRIDPTDPEAFARLLRSRTRWRGVIHLWSLDCPAAEDLTVDAMEIAQTLGCGSILHLTHALDRLEAAEAPRLWLVTRGAQPAGTQAVSGVAQAPVWGFGRVLALEYPDVWGGLIDLGAEASAEAEASFLLDEILDPDAEDQVAMRGVQRYVARLARVEKPEAGGAWSFAPDGSYVVTGGLGDLGLKVAGWLARSGAKHITLIGRTGLPEHSAGQESTVPEDVARKIAAIRTIENSGATVEIAQADVADPAQMNAVFERIRREAPPLRGIVHAAAGIAAQTLRDMTPADLAHGLRAKVSGTWVLHELTQQDKLDVFVLFSSTTSLLGSRYLAHYAAANQFLDSFAHFRKALGQPALAINWGIWDPARVDSALRGRSLQQIGLGAMPAEDALAALGYLLGNSASQMTVAAMDWGALKPLYEARRKRPFLEHIEIRAQKGVRTAAEGDLLRRLREASATGRRDLLAAYLQREIARVLGFDTGSAPHRRQGFFEMGMDSLTSVDLKSRLETGLGVNLPTTLALEYPTIDALAGYLEAELFSASPAPSVEPVKEAPVPAAAAENLDQLSKEHLLSLMAEELAAIEEQK